MAPQTLLLQAPGWHAREKPPGCFPRAAHAPLHPEDRDRVPNACKIPQLTPESLARCAATLPKGRDGALAIAARSRWTLETTTRAFFRPGQLLSYLKISHSSESGVIFTPNADLTFGFEVSVFSQPGRSGWCAGVCDIHRILRARRRCGSRPTSFCAFARITGTLHPRCRLRAVKGRTRPLRKPKIPPWRSKIPRRSMTSPCPSGEAEFCSAMRLRAHA